MWKMGPEWAAQHRKKVVARTANCGVLNARAAERPVLSLGVLWPGAGSASAETGGVRTSSAAGMSRIQAPTPTIAMAVRQSYSWSSHAAKGEMVIGATPMPAETSETARLRLVVNHPVVAAIIGTKN